MRSGNNYNTIMIEVNLLPRLDVDLIWGKSDKLNPICMPAIAEHVTICKLKMCSIEGGCMVCLFGDMNLGGGGVWFRSCLEMDGLLVDQLLLMYGIESNLGPLDMYKNSLCLFTFIVLIGATFIPTRQIQ